MNYALEYVLGLALFVLGSYGLLVMLADLLQLTFVSQALLLAFPL